MERISPLRGLSFRGVEAQVEVLNLSDGEQLALEAEPENEYDPNAIKVLTVTGVHLGYVAKEIAADLTASIRMIELGKYACTVHSGSGTKFININILFYT